jgi:hypothetical protein
METVVTPIEVWVGISAEKIKLEVGPEVRVALRREALRQLGMALEAVRDAEEGMPAMDDPTVRAQLEYLGPSLTSALTACDALWFLAPEYDDGEAPTE